VKDTNELAKRLAPVLNSPTIKGRITASGTISTATMLKERDSSFFLFAGSTDSKVGSVSFSLSGFFEWARRGDRRGPADSHNQRRAKRCVRPRLRRSHLPDNRTYSNPELAPVHFNSQDVKLISRLMSWRTRRVNRMARPLGLDFDRELMLLFGGSVVTSHWRATASRPAPKHIYEPRKGYNDISVFSKSCYGRSLSFGKAVTWRMSDGCKICHRFLKTSRGGMEPTIGLKKVTSGLSGGERHMHNGLVVYFLGSSLLEGSNPRDRARAWSVDAIPPGSLYVTDRNRFSTSLC
jgi:hypothetical protein